MWLVHHPGEFDAERGDLGAFLTGVARKYVHRLQRTERRWLPLDDAAAASRGSYGTEFAGTLERDQEAAELRKAIAGCPRRDTARPWSCATCKSKLRTGSGDSGLCDGHCAIQAAPRPRVAGAQSDAH